MTSGCLPVEHSIDLKVHAVPAHPVEMDLHALPTSLTPGLNSVAPAQGPAGWLR